MSRAGIYVIDQKSEISNVLRQFCQEHPEFEFTGAAHDFESAIAQLSVLQPRIILISLSLPLLDYHSIQRLSDLTPTARLMAYDFADDAAYRKAATLMGIEKFVSTPNLITEIQSWLSDWKGSKG